MGGRRNNTSLRISSKKSIQMIWLMEVSGEKGTTKMVRPLAAFKRDASTSQVTPRAAFFVLKIITSEYFGIVHCLNDMLDNDILLNRTGCSVEVIQNRGPFVFRISSPTQSMQKDFAAPSAEELDEWVTKIRAIAQSANDMVNNLLDTYLFDYSIQIYPFN